MTEKKAKIDRLIEGLTILRKYGDDIDVGHNIFYGPGEIQTTSIDDAEKLRALGWHESRDLDCWSLFI